MGRTSYAVPTSLSCRLLQTSFPFHHHCRSLPTYQSRALLASPSWAFVGSEGLVVLEDRLPDWPAWPECQVGQPDWAEQEHSIGSGRQRPEPPFVARPLE